MSHWTKITTKLNNTSLLKKALTRMGLEFQEGNFTITQYGTTEKAEIKLDDAVGFSQQKDGTYSMVGDFWHSKNPGLKKFYGKNDLFTREIDQHYAIEETVLRMQEQQFRCISNPKAEVDKQGVITMTFEQF